MMNLSNLTIGVLALQGDYELHEHQLGLVGVRSRRVLLPRDLDNLDGLIIPGGESTTMSILLDRFNLRVPLREFGRTKPIYGTCAGMIMVAAEIENNISNVKPLGLMDITVIRNGYGRQVFSFETSVSLDLGTEKADFLVSFIRAPKPSRLGPEVEVLGRYQDDPILVRQGPTLAGSFHAELDDDTRLLEFFLRKFVVDRVWNSPILR